MFARSQTGLLLTFALVGGCGDHLLGAEPCDEPGGTGELVEVAQPWLLTIDEDAENGDALVQISVEPGHEGERTVICEDLALGPELPADTNFTSLVVAEGRIYAAALRETWGDTLVEIDACACTATLIGSFGFDLVSGLAAGPAGSLVGVAAGIDALTTISITTGEAQSLATLTSDWGSNGLTLADGGGLLYGLDASGDRLHTFRAGDGVELGSMALSTPFHAAGLELHPEQGRLYACGVEGQDLSLFEIDLLDGEVTLVAADVFTTRGDNLAGPSGPIACVPD